MKRQLSFALAISLFLAVSGQARADILGTAESFGVLAASAVTNTGPSIIAGDLGIWPGSAISGFPPGLVTLGTTHVTDGVAMQAQLDANTAYNMLAGLAPTQVLTGQDLGGLTLTSGVYFFASSAQLTGTLTLDTQGNPDALFVFQVGSALTTASNSTVITLNGPDDCQIYWQIGSSATLGTGTSFQGNILALASITMATGSSIVHGRALALTGAVTLDDVDVVAGCTCILEPTSLDCNGNGAPDECDISRGTSLDCNANGIPDECDLAGGTSRDCNLNGVPDECDIGTGVSLDCNTNGIPDECDLTTGTSQDCNMNGIPDECEAAGAFPQFTTCDTVPTASVGSALNFQICANSGATGGPITMTLVNTLPLGATLNPPLPFTGDTICTTFHWAPTSGQLSAPVLEFTVVDLNGCRADCKMRVLVTQTVMLFGPMPGSGQITLFGHMFNTQLHGVRRAFAVSSTNAPAPLYAALPSSYSVQVVSYNPVQYPLDAERWSHAMTFTKDLVTQGMLAQYSGTKHGIDILVETFTDSNGLARVRFPFSTY